MKLGKMVGPSTTTRVDVLRAEVTNNLYHIQDGINELYWPRSRPAHVDDWDGSMYIQRHVEYEKLILRSVITEDCLLNISGQPLEERRSV